VSSILSTLSVLDPIFCRKKKLFFELVFPDGETFVVLQEKAEVEQDVLRWFFSRIQSRGWQIDCFFNRFNQGAWEVLLNTGQSLSLGMNPQLGSAVAEVYLQAVQSQLDERLSSFDSLPVVPLSELKIVSETGGASWLKS
jgi:hypothetical protein